MSRNIQARRGSITVLRKKAENYMETKKAEWMEYQSAVTSVLAMGV